MNTVQLVYEMALVIVASGKPLADARALRDVLCRATFSPEEISRHFMAAHGRAVQIRAARPRR